MTYTFFSVFPLSRCLTLALVVLSCVSIVVLAYVIGRAYGRGRIDAVRKEFGLGKKEEEHGDEEK